MFGEDANVTAIEGINATDAPVMIVAGTEDEVVAQDVIGIPAHADELANPHAIIVWADEAPCNMHNTIWLAPEAATFTTQVWAERDAVQEKYDGEVPQDVADAFLASVDRDAMNQLNEDFMEQVEEFYEKAIEA